VTAEESRADEVTGAPARRRERAPVLAPGFQLDDDLTVVDHLGGSRKVDIYQCRSRRLKGVVACKVLRPEYRINFSALEDILQEGQLLQRLRHPNVIRGYGVELQDHPRIVMDYLTGQTLSTIFFQGNYAAFSVQDAVAVTAQLADALTYVHARGLLHLDVKPSNVMYDSGLVTLYDFSVAEEFSPDRPLRDNSGTTEYMAPEQTYRRRVGYATDVFGLGVVLYQLLTGGELPYPVVKRPLPGHDDEEPRRQLDYTVPPRPPSEVNPAVPPPVVLVGMKALQVEVADRFQTPAELKVALLEAARAE
jgi:serine/threonine protein kinase